MVNIYDKTVWEVNCEFEVKTGDYIKIKSLVSKKDIVYRVLDIRPDYILVESSYASPFTIHRVMVEDIKLIQGEEYEKIEKIN